MSPRDQRILMSIMESARNILELVMILESEDRGPEVREVCDLVREQEQGDTVRRVRKVLLEAAMDMWGLTETVETYIVTCLADENILK